jgi:two-component system cell cycle sensor histidine kinase/response regulator CckA
MAGQNSAGRARVQDRVAAILQAAGVGVILSGPDGKPRVWNHAAVELLGITEHDLLNPPEKIHNWNAFHPDGSPFSPEGNAVAKLINPHVPVHDFVVGICRPAPQDQVWLVLNRERLPKDLNRSFTSICILCDASHAMRDATVLHPEQERFRMLLETLPEAVGLTNAEFRQFFYVSPAYEQIFGRTRESLYRDGTSWLEAIPPGDRERVLSALDRLVNYGETLDAEYRVVRPDQTVVWIEKIASHIPKGASEPPMIATSARDVTKRKQAERELIEWKNRYDAAIQASGQILYDWDFETNTTTYSGNTKTVLGYAPEELAGDLSRWLDLIHPDDRESVEKQVERVRETRLPFHHRYRIRKKTGEFIEVQDDGYFAPDAAGKLNRIIGFMIDMSEHRQLEEQLRQSQKMEAVGRLAGGIAHDFNNLLTVILGYAEIVRRDLGYDHPGRRGIDEIEKAGRRAEELTRQLLAFSRRQMLQPKILDLGDIVSDTERMLCRLIGEDIEVRTIRRPHLGRVEADPGQIIHVILNLAVNARDAMPQGGSLVIETSNVTLDAKEVEPHRGIKPGEYVMLTVRDTGTGMTPETQARIFEPFFTTKEQGKGTGLGLSMVYGIVKQSGGDIWVSSEPGKGTTFKILFPRVDGNSEAARPAGGAVRNIQPSAQKILVVEDEPAIRDLVALLLRDSGYKVSEAESAAQAVNMVGADRDSAPDLLIADVVMPGISGPDLAALLSGVRPDMRVLYVSGYTEDIVYRHGILQPGTPLLRKPFTADSLLQKVYEVLNPPAIGDEQE